MDFKGTVSFYRVESNEIMCLSAEQLFPLSSSPVANMTGGHIDGAIVRDHETLDLCPPSCPEGSAALTRLANHFRHRYKQLGAMMSLHAAIILDQNPLVLYPRGHPDRPESLTNLGARLSTSGSGQWWTLTRPLPETHWRSPKGGIWIGRHL